MASEITVMAGLRVKNGNLQFSAVPQNFQADQTSARGPAPGSVHVTTTGVRPDFSMLNRPGWLWLFNLGSVDADWGLYNPSTLDFLPVGVVRAGQGAVFELSPALSDYYDATGTGTTPESWAFGLKTVNGATDVFVGAFDA